MNEIDDCIIFVNVFLLTQFAAYPEVVGFRKCHYINKEMSILEMENKEKIRSRIKKLLSRAESNYSAEAEQALLKAQQLMMEHGINKADIEQEDVQTVVEKKAYHSQVTLWQGGLAEVIASNFRCISIWNFECHAGKQKRVMTFIGFEEDAAIVFRSVLMEQRNIIMRYEVKVPSQKQFMVLRN